MIRQIFNLNVRFLINFFFLDIRNFCYYAQNGLLPSKQQGKIPEFYLRVRGDANDEIDHKRKICSTIRFFYMIIQTLNLNVRFLIKVLLLLLLFFDIRNFAIMHETTLSRPIGKGKFPDFFLRVRGDPYDEIDHKRKK